MGLSSVHVSNVAQENNGNYQIISSQCAAFAYNTFEQDLGVI